ncbi:unnamed protein product [Cercopithifilaria johnstoni]|uniref:Uncharacterized protein n=1 Tax=Cercopithifilaria johnstoni TaxID=2874296 RepID=A0A8J2M327_9BILA|nr:unnamed protein product [Cercopithifilaria johnstoni]
MQANSSPNIWEMSRRNSHFALPPQSAQFPLAQYYYGQYGNCGIAMKNSCTRHYALLTASLRSMVLVFLMSSASLILAKNSVGTAQEFILRGMLNYRIADAKIVE